jgi:hypothetical protein
MLWTYRFEDKNEHANHFIEKAFESKKWDKWLISEVARSGLSERESVADKKEYLARIAGHYVFNDPEIAVNKSLIPGLQGKCVESISDLLREQLFTLGWGKEVGLL